MISIDQTATRLAARLADELTASGDLRTAPWRAATEAVPRHVFVPAFFREHDNPGETLWDPVAPDRVETNEWLDLAYQNETWVTQLDHEVQPDQCDTATPGVPTSSSTLPGLVVMMLEELHVTDTSRVLEIGTGTGYSTALLSHRLPQPRQPGQSQVTSIEVDHAVAKRAAANLHAAGYRPTLVVGDGLAGYPAAAPYDRIIATCSARYVPAEWVRQLTPDGQILMTLTGWFGASSGLLRFSKADAAGEFLGDQVSFMPARAHEPPQLTNEIYELAQVAGSERSTHLTTDVLDQANGWTGAFIAQLAAPTSQLISFSIGGGPMTDYIIDQQNRSCAALLPRPDGSTLVRQSGPVALWDAVENAITSWRRANSPGLEKFRITVTPTSQTIHCPTSDTLRFRLGS